MWPQIIYIVLLLIGLLSSAYKHGQLKKTERYDFPIQFISAILIVLLLAWGGFWNVLLIG